MFELNNFESIKIGLASPERIREWSRGEESKDGRDEDRDKEVRREERSTGLS